MDPLVGRTSRHDEAKQQQHVNSRRQRVREERTADALATSCFFFCDGQNQEVSEICETGGEALMNGVLGIFRHAALKLQPFRR